MQTNRRTVNAISASRGRRITSTTRRPIHGLWRTYAHRGRRTVKAFSFYGAQSSSTKCGFPEEKPYREPLLCIHPKRKWFLITACTKAGSLRVTGKGLFSLIALCILCAVGLTLRGKPIR